MVPNIPMVNLIDIHLFKNITLTLNFLESLNMVNLPHLLLKLNITLLYLTCTRLLPMACLYHCYSVVISGDGWFYDFGDSNRAFKRDCTVYTGY